MKRLRSILKGIEWAFVSWDFLWFLMPLLKGGTGIGMMLGVAVCVLGFLLLLGYRWLSRKGSWQRIAVRVVSVCYVLGLCWCGYLTILMSSAQSRVPPPGTNVMVLGSQVYGIEMGVSLTKRVERAREYLGAESRGKLYCHRRAGQQRTLCGGGGRAPRADSDGCFRSTHFCGRQVQQYPGKYGFSRIVAGRNGLGTEIVIVTQSFHMYRALMLAENAGFTPYALVADTDPVLPPLYYGRSCYPLQNGTWNNCFWNRKERCLCVV